MEKSTVAYKSEKVGHSDQNKNISLEFDFRCVQCTKFEVITNFRF